MNERIKSIRLKLSLTQSEFGEKIGISQNYVWMIEKGDRVPSDHPHIVLRNSDAVCSMLTPAGWKPAKGRCSVQNPLMLS